MQGTRKWRIEGNLRVTAGVSPGKQMVRTGGAAVSQLHGALLSFTLRFYSLMMDRNQGA